MPLPEVYAHELPLGTVTGSLILPLWDGSGNAVKVLVSDLIAAATLDAQTRGIRFVDQWGADPTGATDSTTAIQSCIDAADGGIVMIGKGTYQVSTLTIKKGITLAGSSSWNSILKGKSGSSGWMLVVDGSLAGSQQNRETNQVPCTIRDLYLDGNARQSNYGGIYLNLVDHVLVDNVFVWEFSRSALFLNQSVRECVFRKLFVRYCGNQDATDNHGAGWPGVSVVDHPTGVNDLEDTHNGLTFDSCQVVFCLGDHFVIDSDQIHSGRKPSNIVLRGCWIHGWNTSFTTVSYYSTLNASATMKAYYLLKVACAYNVTVVGNRLSFCGSGKSAITFTRSALGGSAVTGKTYDPEDVIVTDNYFNGAWNTATEYGYGVNADYGSGVVANNRGDSSIKYMLVQGPGFRMDGHSTPKEPGVQINTAVASSYVTSAMLTVGASDFTVHLRVRMPDAWPSTDAGLWTLTSATGSIAVQGIGAFFTTAGQLRVILYGATSGDTRTLTVDNEWVNNWLGKAVDLTFVRSVGGSTFKIYLNGGELPSRENTAGSAPAWSSTPTTTRFNLGVFLSSNPYTGAFYQARVANRALSAADVQLLERQGIAPADRWGNMTELSSGTLTIGQRYRITARAASDFTTVGAAANTVGTEFIATGTGSGLLTGSNKVIPVGWVLDWDLGEVHSTCIIDRSSNLLHATMSGGVSSTRQSGLASIFDVTTSNQLKALIRSTLTQWLFDPNGAGAVATVPGLTLQRTTTQTRLTLGDNAGSNSPQNGIIEAEPVLSGTDVAGKRLILSSGKGTGAGTTSFIDFQVAIPGASGGSPQSTQVAASVRGTSVTDETCLDIYYWNGAAFVGKQVKVGAADSAGAGFRLLRITN